MRSYPVKENPIGSSVREILRYKHTDILLLYYKDKLQDVCLPRAFVWISLQIGTIWLSMSMFTMYLIGPGKVYNYLE